LYSDKTTLFQSCQMVERTPFENPDSFKSSRYLTPGTFDIRESRMVFLSSCDSPRKVPAAFMS
jgi:hypothetical protein